MPASQVIAYVTLSSPAGIPSTHDPPLQDAHTHPVTDPTGHRTHCVTRRHNPPTPVLLAPSTPAPCTVHSRSSLLQGQLHSPRHPVYYPTVFIYHLLSCLNAADMTFTRSRVLEMPSASPLWPRQLSRSGHRVRRSVGCLTTVRGRAVLFDCRPVVCTSSFFASRARSTSCKRSKPRSVCDRRHPCPPGTTDSTRWRL